MNQSLSLPIRPRRNRKSAAIRGLCQETRLSPQNFIYPLFVHAGDADEPIDSMPGCTRRSVKGLVGEAKEAQAAGVNAVVLFPAIAAELKTPHAVEAFNDDGLIPQAVKALKETLPDLVVTTDVALDPYNSDGHDGVVGDDGRILNDFTVSILCQQALSHARAGADIISPSDMMDGRVGAIREALDGEGYEDVSILSYTAKYASAYYGPFRGALDSAPKAGDKKTYQMDPANRLEALREAELDVEEGADMVMVKPAGPYLDIVRELADNIDVPIAAYQVSGEYLMIKSAAAAGWLDEKNVVLESLTGIRRAGASVILTYFAKQAAQWLGED